MKINALPRQEEEYVNNIRRLLFYPLKNNKLKETTGFHAMIRLLYRFRCEAVDRRFILCNKSAYKIF